MATTTQLLEKLLPDSISERPRTDSDSRTRRVWSLLKGVHPLSWLVLCVALLALNLFAYETLLVPQPRNYHADWLGARWITAPNISGTTAFFRKSFDLGALPRGAFLEVQGSQSLEIYANGTQLDNTDDDFAAGATNRAYVYDVTPFLQTGRNTIALCAMNRDDGTPAMRAVIGLAFGDQRQTLPSGSTWLATGSSQIAGGPCSITSVRDWASPGYNDEAWQNATALTTKAPPDGVMPERPITFETPVATTWLSAGSGSDAFLYRAVNLPSTSDAWLRVASSGQAQVFLNGHQIVAQPAKVQHNPSGHALPAEAIVTNGIYDITPFVHSGENTLGVHVTTIGADLKSGTPRARPAAMTLDLFVTNGGGQVTHIVADHSWWASASATPEWQTGAGTDHWSSAIPIDSSVFGPRSAPFLPTGDVSMLGAEMKDPVSVIRVLLLTTLLFGLVCAFAVSIQMLRRRRARNVSAAIDRVALAMIPMEALIALLIALNLEPLMPRPFPFTRLWLGLIIAVAVLTFTVIMAADRLQPAEKRLMRLTRYLPARLTPATLAIGLVGTVLVLIGLYMVTYNLSYEVYWQDEVTSIYAAKGILHTGLPKLISGFIYQKAELYSYMLAVPMAIFGDGPIATRALSVIEYVLSLVLTYFIGRYFLGRRVGLLAMLLLVFSPMAVRWGREARMYQQAELLLLISVYLFYRAVQPRAPSRYIYLSMFSIVAMYLSHEETFILLPAIALYFVLTQRLSWIRNPHWWIAGCPAIAIVVFELYLTKATHPPIIGTDHTQLPLISFSPNNVTYYLRLLFVSRALKGGTLAELGVTSTFAMVAAIRSLFTTDRALRYLGLCLVMPLVVLALVLTLTSDRYIYPLLPLFCFLAASTVFWALEWINAVSLTRLRPVARHALIGSTLVVLTASLVVAQTPALANFGLAVSRTLGITYRHHYPEYQLAGDYVKAHWQPGDILITVSPAIDGAYYAERPNFLLYQSKALYLFEQNGHIVDTPTGSIVLLNGNDLGAVLAKYHRIWLWSSPGYQCCGRTEAFPIDQNFSLVYEGNDTLVYLRRT